jgi:hypothetical protein
MMIDAGIDYSRRNYRSRVTQSVDGNYLSDKLYVNETNINFSFSYPLAKHFRARAMSNFGRSRSNTSYEAVYRYNYNSSNYLFGFIYDY